MKFSFSTKGWHNSTFEEFCDIAQELGFEGFQQERSSAKEEYTPDFDLTGV